MKKTLPFLLTLPLALSACNNATTSTNTVSAPVAAVAAPELPTDPYAQSAPISTQALSRTATTSDPYNITLNFAPGSDQRVIDAMKAAAARWEGIITKGLPAVNVNIPAGACGSNAAFVGQVDDILVFTGSKAIDGPGGILAQSGPCSIRSTGGLTVYATLVFDSADLDAFGSQLPAIAMHELGHSLGIGSLWKNKGLTLGSGTTDPEYTGSNGIREYHNLGGVNATVPEENQGGQGTAESHWREKTLNNELMTGYLNSGSNPLSRLSIAGLNDLGYSVDYSKADTFSAGTINTLSLPLNIGAHEQVFEPKWQVR